MNQTAPPPSPLPTYPAGIEYRTPRPRQVALGTLLGGLAGLLLTQNAGGTILGTAVGGALGNAPLELSQALRQNFAARGFPIAHYYRQGRFGAKIIFKYGERFVAIESRAPQQPAMSLEQIEDWLYGDLTEVKLNDFIGKYSRRFVS